METIHLERHSNGRKNSIGDRSVGSKSQSREKVLHSAFQIHRLYKKKPKGTTVYPPLEATSDNRDSFAFRRKEDSSSSRYSSRVQ